MAEPVPAVIAVGSNIDKEHNLPEAVHMLRRAEGITVEKVSRVFQSRSVGGGDAAPDFFNAAVLVTTDLDYEGLRSLARDIEDRLGRERTADRDAPRTADLDIVYYADLVADGGGLVVPDPDALTAAHVAVPVADAAPDMVHPTDGRTARQIAEQFDADSVHPVMALHLSKPYDHPEDFDDVGEVYSPRMEALVRDQLLELGEDPEREGLQRTPLRVAKALDYLTSGYQTSVEEIINGAIFDAEGADEMVMVKDIEFYSMCEHHLLPFFGTAAVAYLPKGKIIGLSKIARIVDVYARRFQVQERMTNQIAEALEETLEPHGVAVVLEGKHLCMMMRGVQKQEGSMITSAMRGTFSDDPRTRAEFLDLTR